MARDIHETNSSKLLSALSAINPNIHTGQRSTTVIERILTTLTMAAALSALNAKIRSQPVLNYVCSTRTSKPANHAHNPPKHNGITN